MVLSGVELASCQDACARRGGKIGVEYQELLHGNGPIILCKYRIILFNAKNQLLLSHESSVSLFHSE